MRPVFFFEWRLPRQKKMMMKQASYLFIALLVQALLLFEPTLGQDLEPVGRIISVQGNVEARGGGSPADLVIVSSQTCLSQF